MKILVIGGGRSGKSGYAERCAESLCADPSRRLYVATSVPFDEEMRLRIAKHREDRGSKYVTCEEPHDLAGVLRRLPDNVEVVLIDCLTVWLGNLMYQEELEAEKNGKPISFRTEDREKMFGEEIDFLEELAKCNRHVVIVSNEVGLGLIPGDAYSRRFRDLAGRLNQRTAQIADCAVFMAAGLPLVMKGTSPLQ